MFNDEDFGKKPKQIKDLEPMSLDELDDYIAQMKEEIERARREIDKKKLHMATASSIFK